jgi:hypothetical protein
MMGLGIDIDDLLAIKAKAEALVDAIVDARSRLGPGGRRVTLAEAGGIIEAGGALLGTLVGLVTPWR